MRRGRAGGSLLPGHLRASGTTVRCASPRASGTTSREGGRRCERGSISVELVVLAPGLALLLLLIAAGARVVEVQGHIDGAARDAARAASAVWRALNHKPNWRMSMQISISAGASTASSIALEPRSLRAARHQRRSGLTVPPYGVVFLI